MVACYLMSPPFYVCFPPLFPSCTCSQPGLKLQGVSVGAIVDALSPTSEAAENQIFIGDR